MRAREGAGMSIAKSLAAPGDRLREWWGQLSRVQKWGFGALGFVVLALLPVYTLSFLNTPGISFDGVLAQFAMVALIAIGLNVVVGQAGLLDLRIRRLLRCWRIHLCAADESGQPVESGGSRRLVHEGLGVAGVRAVGDRVHRAGGLVSEFPRCGCCEVTTWQSSPSDSAKSSG